MLILLVTLRFDTDILGAAVALPGRVYVGLRGMGHTTHVPDPRTVKQDEKAFALSRS